MYMLPNSKYSNHSKMKKERSPYLFLLLVEIVDDDTNKKVESEK